MSRSILIVDDDDRIRITLSQALSTGAAQVQTAGDAEEALVALASARPDVVLSDVRMPGMGGVELLRLLKERAPDVDVVLMTAFDDLATVATSMREGASDFLVKPLDLHELRGVLDRVFADREARGERGSRQGLDGSRAEAPPPGTERRSEEGPPDSVALVGRDPRMLRIFKVVGQVAATRANVVIRGESGTGKELIARAIHASSPDAERPFVAVNCMSLPSTLLESELFGHVRGAFTGATGDRRGRFALAGRGTISLDEIGDTSLEFQAKLLRVLQEHEFYPVGAERPERTEARVIAATHRDLEAMVREGSFRQDLYYRLRVVEVTLPPLRERPGDIPPLATHLLAKAARLAGRLPPLLSDEALVALLAHGWPGNVRELEHSLTRAVVMATGDVIHPEHLSLEGPEGPAGTEPGLVTLQAWERRHVARVLEATRWHKARASELLGVSRPRLNRLIARHGLEPPERLGT